MRRNWDREPALLCTRPQNVAPELLTDLAAVISSRADTIDLQDHDGPSTQNQSHPRFDPDDVHHRAPHQAETLREVAHETAQELLRGPIIPPVEPSPSSYARSQTNQSASDTRHPADLDVSDIQDPDAQAADLTDAFTMDAYRHHHEQDAIVAAHNGASSSEEDDLDGDASDDLDDDLMDKISSSPSIEDGVYNSSPASTKSASARSWPCRVSSLPTTSRFRRQAAARFFSSQLQTTPVSQQSRHLLLSRSNRPTRTKDVESRTDTDPAPAIDAKPEAIQDKPKAVQLDEKEALSTEEQTGPLTTQQDLTLD